MKYKVGDLILVKKCEYKSHHRHLHPLLRLHPRPLRRRLFNTIGIITEVKKHSDIFEKDSTENDNGYIWYSQVDGREYYFYEDEAECEVIV
jgi:hypothetical protein